MLFIPLIYFSLLAGFFYMKHRCLNLDIAATIILIAISVFSILIDVNDVYGDYGINEYAVSLPTILLYCLQWTLVLIPLHFLSLLKLKKHEPEKGLLLYIVFGLVILSSAVMIVTSLGDIKEALVMDMVDMYRQNAELREISVKTESNYLMLLPQILTAAPFPTMALFFWFYLKTFTNSNIIIRLGLLGCSVVQAALSIIVAGRAALIYWIFDFFLIYAFFYQYLSAKLKKTITIVSAVIGTVVIGQLLVITISRFGEESGDNSRDPLVSLYAYAGQHVNNFCAMFEAGGDAPLQIGRVFPLTNKIVNHENFDLIQHYENIHAAVDVMANVFDTFGGEVYLDLGWIGYILMIVALILLSMILKYNWEELTFYRVFFLIVAIAFFTRALFAWPFVGHYTTLALLFTFVFHQLFKFKFKV